jgi:diaminopimelate epimerase
MLNPDGTHAEMCGNGIRCVARLANERGYLKTNTLYSGGREFNISIATPIAQGIETFAVEIPIGLSSPSFAFYDSNARFVGEVIDKLDKNLRFTALNLGNPHIVAEVESIDMALLEHLGERVKSLTDIFPHGVNVSLYECRTRRSIFVATYERGAGITLSCGTAMTASATAAALLGKVDREERIEVRNRGGKVYCTTRGVESPITTLEGNATYNWRGMASFTDGKLSYSITEHTEEEQRWQMVAQGIE